MHVHPPKPLHGWKEFLNEIFVIVVGVLIALGFEQVVEELHWRHKVHEGEERLQGEARRNFQRAAEHLTVTPCVDAQIEALMDRLRHSGTRMEPAPETEMRRLPGLKRVLIVPYRSSSEQVWQALQLDGTTSHFNKARQLELSSLYNSVRGFDQLAQETRSLRDQLDVMAEPLELTPELKASLLQLLHELRGKLHGSRLTARQTINQIQNLGLAPTPEELAPFLESSAKFGTIGICKAKGLPLADWRKEAEAEAPLQKAANATKD
jgi:hypothetical protein